MIQFVSTFYLSPLQQNFHTFDCSKIIELTLAHNFISFMESAHRMEANYVPSTYRHQYTFLV